MFTPLNIQVALEGLFDLCDPDVLMDMFENYGEEFDDISPELLSKAFQISAETVPEYQVLSNFGTGFNYESSALLSKRAVRILYCATDLAEDGRVTTIQKKELWLQEDMTFCTVSCVSTFIDSEEDKLCVCEHRELVTTVECEEDIFFDIGTLVCELDDICMFESLLGKDATVCEP